MEKNMLKKKKNKKPSLWKNFALASEMLTNAETNEKALVKKMIWVNWNQY